MNSLLLFALTATATASQLGLGESLVLTGGRAYSEQGTLKDYTVRAGLGHDTASFQVKLDFAADHWSASGWQLDSEVYGLSALDNDLEDGLLVFAPVQLGQARENGMRFSVDFQAGVGLNLLSVGGISSTRAYLGPYLTVGARGQVAELTALSGALRPVGQGGLAAGLALGDALELRVRAAQAIYTQSDSAPFYVAHPQGALNLGFLTGVYTLSYDEEGLIDGSELSHQLSVGLRF